MTKGFIGEEVSDSKDFESVCESRSGHEWEVGDNNVLFCSVCGIRKR